MAGASIAAGWVPTPGVAAAGRVHPRITERVSEARTEDCTQGYSKGRTQDLAEAFTKRTLGPAPG